MVGYRGINYWLTSDVAANFPRGWTNHAAILGYFCLLATNPG
jgi:hypothetical protein